MTTGDSINVGPVEFGSTQSAGPTWASDAVVEILGELGIQYVALNPGASYRGLHDSLVNFETEDKPSIILCLHEEHAAAIAHGYAKVANRPMGVAVHSNVGLMHASMAMYNAWCDRVPMLVLGATGPVDAMRRRPWIEWIHTAADQGALVRNFTKWDDQPASVGAALESLVRAFALTSAAPSAPVYVCLDSAIQESRLTEPYFRPTVSRYRPSVSAIPGENLGDAVSLLTKAERPLILIGRVNRSTDDWDIRVRLAEQLGAAVLADTKIGATFPSAHPQLAAPPEQVLTAQGAEVVRRADLVLSLDWVDLGGTLRQVFGGREPPVTVISCSNDDVLWNGWSKDHGGFSPVDCWLHVDADQAARSLLSELEGRPASTPWEHSYSRSSFTDPSQSTVEPRSVETLDLSQLAQALNSALANEESCLIRLPLRWDGKWSHFAHPLDYLGYDGGGGLGSGPGMAVGAALALKATSRLPVAVLGDGDCAMGISALWTAARYRIPLLVIVANNHTYGNDEAHQSEVARSRERNEANHWVGQRMADPKIDYSKMAEGQGWIGYGPVLNRLELDRILSMAIKQVRAGGCVLVDVDLVPAV